jgi:two-component system, response regulator, stage 0 sporulation protein F
MRPRLLVVDDEENLRELYRLELGEEGYEVNTAASAREATIMLSAAKYDVIVLDIKMPGMLGIELMHRIMAKDRLQPVILNTSYTSHRENFMAWAADAYVVKSFCTSELKRVIQDVLANHP